MADVQPLILLVDDDTDFVEMNRHVLEARGYRVAVAHDAAEAAAHLAAQLPDLVITDLVMSDLNAGFAFARGIKEDPRTKGTPVIIVTGVSSQLGFDFRPRTPQDLAAMHVDAYFDKPVSPQALLEKVKTLLAQR